MWKYRQTCRPTLPRAAVPQVATLLTTRPGQAALGIVRDSGDALPKLLSKCHSFVDRGRDAMSCTLWARGAGLSLTTATPLAIMCSRPLRQYPHDRWPPYRHCRGCAVCLAQRSSRSGEGDAWLVKPAEKIDRVSLQIL
jgi:hypothetical protein